MGIDPHPLFEKTNGRNKYDTKICNKSKKTNPNYENGLAQQCTSIPVVDNNKK